MVSQFSVLSELYTDKTVANEAEVETVAVAEKSNEVNVNALAGLSTKTLNVLEKNGISLVSVLVEKTEEEILALEGMGAKGIKEIKKAIDELGLNLK